MTVNDRSVYVAGNVPIYTTETETSVQCSYFVVIGSSPHRNGTVLNAQVPNLVHIVRIVNARRHPHNICVRIALYVILVYYSSSDWSRGT